jgi:hypothetical protein
VVSNFFSLAGGFCALFVQHLGLVQVFRFNLCVFFSLSGDLRALLIQHLDLVVFRFNSSVSVCEVCIIIHELNHLVLELG